MWQERARPCLLLLGTSLPTVTGNQTYYYIFAISSYDLDPHARTHAPHDMHDDISWRQNCYVGRRAADEWGRKLNDMGRHIYLITGITYGSVRLCSYMCTGDRVWICVFSGSLPSAVYLLTSSYCTHLITASMLTVSRSRGRLV